MIAKMLLVVILGWMGHKLERPTRTVFGDHDLNRLASYAEGTLLLLIGFLIVRDRSRDDFIDFILASFSVGAGTVAGYIEEEIRGVR